METELELIISIKKDMIELMEDLIKIKNLTDDEAILEIVNKWID